MKPLLFGPAGFLLSILFLLSSQVAVQSATPAPQKSAYLGVVAPSVTEDLTRVLALKKRVGAWVAFVVPDSPGERAGVSAGDVILAMNGEPIDSSEKVVAIVRKLEPGAALRIQVWRNGVLVDLTAHLEASDTSFYVKHSSCGTNRATYHFARYHGDCREGIAEGIGFAEAAIPIYRQAFWRNPSDKNVERKFVYSYFGEFKNGLPNGMGTMTVPAGVKIANFELTHTYTYKGKFVDGNPTGEGVVRYGDSVETLTVSGLRKNWGDLAELTQDRWLADMDGPVMDEYTWLLPGLVMHNAATVAPSGGMIDRIVIHHNVNTGSLDAYGMRAEGTWVGRPDADGAVLLEPENRFLRSPRRIAKTSNGVRIDNGRGHEHGTHFAKYSEAEVKRIQARVAVEKRAEQESSDRFWGAVAQGINTVGGTYAETRESNALDAARERERIAPSQEQANLILRQPIQQSKDETRAKAQVHPVESGAIGTQGSARTSSSAALTVDDDYAKQVRKHREMVEAQQKRAELRDAEQRRITARKQAEIDAENARRAADAKQAREDAIALREKRKKICEATGKECGALASKQ